jgi:transcriptional regulator with XRE-family HTH domain
MKMSKELNLKPKPMTYPIVPSPDTPLNILLRRRREELKLSQAEVAEALRVRPESVCLWESGRRRLELCKVPRLAVFLKLDPQSLCAKALAEYHRHFFISLFPDYPTVPAKYPPVQSLEALRCSPDSVAARNKQKLLDAACETW